MRALLLAPLLLAGLAACQPDEPENVQTRARNASVALEERYNQIEAEAENGSAEAAAPLENEADSLLNQLNGTVPAEANSSGNRQ